MREGKFDLVLNLFYLKSLAMVQKCRLICVDISTKKIKRMQK